MKLLFISTADKNYDGRTRVLIDLVKTFADVIEITAAKDEEYYSSNEYHLRLNNSMDYYKFLKKSIKIAKKHKDIDCLFIDNRKATIAGLKLKNIINPKITIYDARELYLREEMNTIYSKIGCIFEEKMINKSNMVICANEERRKIMESRYVNTDFLVFENFRKLEYSQNIDKKNIEKKFTKYFNNTGFRIVSTGGCDLDRGTDRLVSACAKLSYKYSLFLVGTKEDSDKLIIENLKEQYNIKSIYFIPKLSQNELKYFLSKCDVGIAIYHKKNANNLYCASGKVYEYIYEGLPVAVSDNPPLINLVNDYKVGICSSDIHKALEEVYVRHKELKNNVNTFIDKNIVENKQKEFSIKLKKYCMEVNFEK